MKIVRRISSILIAVFWILQLWNPSQHLVTSRTLCPYEYTCWVPDWRTTLAQGLAVTIGLSWPWWLVKGRQTQ